MKNKVNLLVFSLTVLLGCRLNATAQSLDKLRTIRIERQTMLILGARMPQPSHFCDWLENTCVLKPGTFWGAKGMSLVKTESGLISQFNFDYGALSPEAVDNQIEDYTQHFGKPTNDSTTKDGAIKVRKIEWSDSATSFELIYKIDQSKIEALAVLFDKVLTGGR